MSLKLETQNGHFITDAVGWVISGVCDFVRVGVGALKEKRLELSTPNLAQIYSLEVAWHALTRMSKGQRSRPHGYENRHGRMVAAVAVVILLPACDCLGF